VQGLHRRVDLGQLLIDLAEVHALEALAHCAQPAHRAGLKLFQLVVQFAPIPWAVRRCVPLNVSQSDCTGFH